MTEGSVAKGHTAAPRVFVETVGPSNCEPVVFVHGLGSDSQRNWKESGWIDMLIRRERRAVLVDLLGHGRSAKPHDVGSYALPRMAREVANALRKLAITRFDCIGYSLGAEIALGLGHEAGLEVSRTVLAAPFGQSRPEFAWSLAERLRTGRSTSDTNVEAFYTALMAEPNDRLALSACLEAQVRWPSPRPTIPGGQNLVITGERDDVAGARDLSRAAPGSRLVVIAGLNHWNLARSQRVKETVLAFLQEGHPIGWAEVTM